MHKRNKRQPCRKIVLKLPDLDHAKSAVLNSLSSPHSRRNYKFAMEQFITWYCSEPRLALNRVGRYISGIKQLPAPFGDDFDCSVDHFDSCLIVNGIRRHGDRGGQFLQVR